MATRQIGWYGLGSMGLAMASNLQRHLSAVRAQNLVYANRTASRGDALQKLGGVQAKSFDDVVKKSGIIFTMVSNDTVLRSLINNTISNISTTTTSSTPTDLSQKIFVDCSTVHPETITSISRELSAHKVTFLSAPVFGGNPVATAGKLVFALAGGTSNTRDTLIKPLIQDVMGRKVIDCGDDPAKASLLKIAGNIVTVSLMETVGEAQVFAERTGLGTDTMEELIGEAFGPIAGGYSKRLTSGAYAPPLTERPGFGVSLSIKDADHALSIARDTGLSLPSVELARTNMAAAREYGGECLDSSSMYGILRQKAGLAFWNEKSRQGGK